MIRPGTAASTIRPARMWRTRSQVAKTSGISSEISRMPTPRSRQLAHDLVDALLVLDVDADGRAVEDQDLGLGGEPLGEHDALLVAARELSAPDRSRPGILIASRATQSAASLRRRAGSIRPDRPARRLRTASTRLSSIDCRMLRPRSSRSSEQVGDAGADRVLVRAQRERPSLEPDRARVGTGHAEERERQLGAAGAQQAGQAQDLAAREREGDVRRTRPRG